MKKANIIKIKVILAYIFLIISVSGCRTENGGVSGEPASYNDIHVQTESPQETEETYIESEASEKPEDEYIDIDSVDGTDVDYGKYNMESDTTVTEKRAVKENSDEDNSGKRKKVMSYGYNTDPVPSGKPEPVEPEDAVIDKEDTHTCTLTIDCKTILDNMDDFDDRKTEILPKDGIILEKTEVTYVKGESVFDILLRETKNRHIHMEYSFTPLYNSSYIEGIANLYEYDCGDLSGWMYLVNGWSPNYGLSRYQVSDGDDIEIRYTCNLGSDL